MILTRVDQLQTTFARFGVAIEPAEAAAFATLPPREAITHLLASREITARFDAAHGRAPNETDLDLLVEAVDALG
jgi:hypothetical protein